MADRESLLDELWRRVGCNYLSDLSLPHCARAVASALADVSPVDYALAEWQEVHTYVVGEAPDGSNTEEIWGSILRYLKGK